MINDGGLDSAWRVLKAAQPVLPRRGDLEIEIADAAAAQARGYYLPDEDERLREVYVNYLGARAGLWTMINDLQPHIKSGDLRVFGLAFCAAAILTRSATFLLELAKDRPVVWNKLDEAESRFSIERKSFTRIYANLGSPGWMWRYRVARQFYEIHHSEIHQTLRDSHFAEIIPWLEQEEPHFETRKRTIWNRLAAYRLHSITRSSTSGYTKVMFHLFRLSGCAIADMKQPFLKPLGADKRTTAIVREMVQSYLKPGDVFVTRHDDAMSNLFLPGYWPHAALYLGSETERTSLGLPSVEDATISVLEAKKDGVRFRQLAETLQVDAFVVVRPKINPEHLRQALARAMTHAGKLYDFVFDFRKADRLVCTEVVYRAYHGIGPMNFELTKQSGRLALSAEDFLRQGLAKDLFEVVLIFGVDGTPLQLGAEALATLQASLRR